jgi:hypothetical protein
MREVVGVPHSIPRVRSAFMITLVLMTIINTLSPSSRKKPFLRANSMGNALMLGEVWPIFTSSRTLSSAGKIGLGENIRIMIPQTKA